MVKAELVAFENVERLILIVRGHRVLLDRDLAALYGVAVKALNQAVRRNRTRFPGDFMFSLSLDEARSLETMVWRDKETRHSRSQSVTLNVEAHEIKGLPGSARWGAARA